LDYSVAAPLLELQAPQAIHIQDFYDSRRNPANKALLFQSREGAFGGSGCHSKIVRKVEPIHRQAQTRRFFVEELRDPQKIDQTGSQALMGILLTEHHDQGLRLKQIVNHRLQHRELEFGIGQHETKHLIPENALNPNRADSFRQIRVLAVVSETNKVARHLKPQDLTMTVFGEPAKPDDPLVYEIDEMRICALRENRSASAKIERRRDMIDLLPVLF
jgi:hypothetical protein